MNEVAQFGNSVGLAVTAAIAASVTEHSTSDDALLEGYRAAFWTIFVAATIVMVLTFFGLRNTGLVGSKED